MSTYQLLPALSPEEYQALKSDIAKHGVQVPVEYDDEGNILDGYNRVRICQELGITEWPRIIRPGLSEEEKRAHARRLNLNRRHLSQEQRRELIAEQLRETPHLSDRQIARHLGVSNPTVSATRHELVESGEVLNLNTSQGADGKWYPRVVEREARHDTREFLNNPATWQARHDDEFNREQILEANRQGACIPVPTVPHVAQNSGDNEWYTPAEYIAAAREVMGGIDLDPASHPTANEVVGAATFYTAEDDGLSKEWAGRVWMNPPYAQPLCRQFCERLVTSQAVDQAVVLVNNATETAWFQELAAHASAICFPAGRVRFWAPDKVSAPLQGQAVLYFGHRVDAFRDAFHGFGFTVGL